MSGERGTEGGKGKGDLQLKSGELEGGIAGIPRGVVEFVVGVVVLELGFGGGVVVHVDFLCLWGARVECAREGGEELVDGVVDGARGG